MVCSSYIRTIDQFAKFDQIVVTDSADVLVSEKENDAIAHRRPVILKGVFADIEYFQPLLCINPSGHETVRGPVFGIEIPLIDLGFDSVALLFSLEQ